MGKHNDNMFKKVVTGGLRNAQRDGLAQGAFAMCRVILAMAKDESKTPDERIEGIVAFCSKCIEPVAGKGTDKQE